MSDSIVIRGAREHNLKNVDLELRATDSSSSPACRARGRAAWPSTPSTPRASAATSSRCRATPRQFLGQMDKPDVDFIEGLSPAISIDQKSASRNPRSTVGTITEVYDYLRLLYARIGIPHCPTCGRLDHPPDARSRSSTGCCSSPRAPASRCWRRSCGAARASTKRCSTELAGQGFHARARIDGRASVEPGRRRQASSSSALREPHDRGRRRPTGAPRRHRASAHRLARDRAAAGRGRGRGRDRPQGSKRARRPDDPHVLRAPRLHALRAVVRGARAAQLLVQLALRRVRRCDGLGTRSRSTPSWSSPTTTSRSTTARSPPGRAFGASTSSGCSSRSARRTASRPTTPWKKLTAKATPQDRSSTAHRASKSRSRYKNRYGRQRRTPPSYEGVMPWLERRHTEADSDASREQIEGYMRRCRARCARARGSARVRWP